MSRNTIWICCRRRVEVLMARNLLMQGHETELDMSGKEIGTVNVSPLMEALKTNTSLTKLNLSNNKIKEVAALADAVGENTSVTALDLSSNEIVDVAALADMLTSNGSLVSLNLGGNQIKEVAALADAVGKNQSLVTLILRGNLQFSDSDRAALEAAWKMGDNGRALGTAAEKVELNLLCREGAEKELMATHPEPSRQQKVRTCVCF